ncbi:hypothetical protein DBR06_SOUSAS16110002, partial [Sousa chinensis]
TSLEQLNKLPPIFKDEGTISVRNVPEVSDALVIASKDAAKKHNITLTRIVSYFVSRCDLSVIDIGFVPTSNGALKKRRLCLKDVDLVEVNGAFPPQYLAVEKSLDLDPGITNLNGRAITWDQPLGGSGSSIIAHMVHELRCGGG